MIRTTIALTMVLAALMFIACEDSPDTPEAAVEQFFEALSRNDQGQLLDSLCPSNRGDVGGMQFVLNFFGLDTVPVGYRDLQMDTVMQGEGRAIVHTTGSLRLLLLEQPFEVPFPVMRENGRWYVCDDTAGFPISEEPFAPEF